MKLTLDDDQLDLQRVTRGFVARHSSLARTRELADSAGRRYDDSVWQRVCTQLGVGGLLADLDRGGAGAGLTEASIAAEEFGAAIDSCPLLPTSAAVIIMESVGGTFADQYVPQLIDGSMTASVAFCETLEVISPLPGSDTVHVSGTAADVLGAQDADQLLIIVTSAQESRLVVIATEAPGVVVDDVRTLDLTRRFGHVRLENVVGQSVALSNAAATDMHDRVDVLIAAELSGLTRAMLAMTTDYLKTRVAFGRTIGSFQAVKHRLADMYCQLELLQSAVRAATSSADSGSSDFHADALITSRAASGIAVDVTTECLRLTGGIGYTWEHDAHLFVRRAHQDQSLFGGRARTDRELLAVIKI